MLAWIKRLRGRMESHEIQHLRNTVKMLNAKNDLREGKLDRERKKLQAKDAENRQLVKENNRLMDQAVQLELKIKLMESERNR